MCLRVRAINAKAEINSFRFTLALAFIQCGDTPEPFISVPMHVSEGSWHHIHKNLGARLLVVYSYSGLKISGHDAISLTILNKELAYYAIMGIEWLFTFYMETRIIYTCILLVLDLPGTIASYMYLLGQRCKSPAGQERKQWHQCLTDHSSKRIPGCREGSPPHDHSMAHART